MNYKIEGGLDFYAMLADGPTKTEEEDVSRCLISGMPLNYTAVKRLWL